MTDSNPARVSRGRLSGAQRGRLGRLLDMLYTPRELAEEIGFTVKQIYKAYLPLDCPSEKDATGHRWINGKAFREWFNQTYPKVTVAEDETFCQTCKRAVPMVNPVKHQTKYRTKRVLYALSDCPYCGRRRLARFLKR